MKEDFLSDEHQDQLKDFDLELKELVFQYCGQKDPPPMDGFLTVVLDFVCCFIVDSAVGEEEKRFDYIVNLLKQRMSDNKLMREIDKIAEGTVDDDKTDKKSS